MQKACYGADGGDDEEGAYVEKWMNKKRKRKYEVVGVGVGWVH